MKSMKLLPRAAIPLSVAFIVNLGCVYAGQGVIDLRAVQGGSVKVLEDYSGRPDEHGVMEICTWQRAHRRFNCPRSANPYAACNTVWKRKITNSRICL